MSDTPLTDNDVIAEAARRAGKEGNDRFFAKLKEKEKQQRYVADLERHANAMAEALEYLDIRVPLLGKELVLLRQTLAAWRAFVKENT